MLGQSIVKTDIVVGRVRCKNNQNEDRSAFLPLLFWFSILGGGKWAELRIRVQTVTSDVTQQDRKYGGGKKVK